MDKPDGEQMTDAQHLEALYVHIRQALDLCEVFALKAKQPWGNAAILALNSALTEEFGAFWLAFRRKWGIPDLEAPDHEAFQRVAFVLQEEMHRCGAIGELPWRAEGIPADEE